MAFEKVSTAKPAPRRKAYTPKDNETPPLDPTKILEETDIVSLISEVVELKQRAGKDEMIGLCPFHGDSHPSFEVNGAKGIYSCWSCSAGLNNSRGGDAITFVRRYYQMGYFEAMEFLARRAGIPIPAKKYPAKGAAPVARPAFVPRAPITPRGPVKGEPNLDADKTAILEAISKAQEVFAGELLQNQVAMDYLFNKRAIDPALLGKYSLGYAPESFGTLRKHFTEYDSSDLLIDAGLSRISSKDSKYDFFRDRITFGVKNAQGKVVAFGGRRLSDADKLTSKGEVVRTPKYLNTPETAVFSKRDEIFGWQEAKPAVIKDGFALIVEGYMDVLGLASQKVENASACMGTALTESHIMTMLETTKHLVFCMDGDRAGQEGAFRSLSGLFPHMDPGVKVNFLTLPDDMDPDEYARKYGRGDFLKRVKSAHTLPQFWETTLSALYPTDQADKRDLLWRNARDLVDLLPENSEFRVELMEIAGRLAQKASPKQPSPPSARKGLSTFLVNEPSDRLFLAVMRLPHVAAGMRPTLISQQKAIESALLPTLVAWQNKYDQAMAAGMATPQEPSSEAEKRQYTAIIEASISILTQYLASAARESMEKALQSGQMDETTYLRKVQRSCFAKPS